MLYTEVDQVVEDKMLADLTDTGFFNVFSSMKQI